MARNDDRTRDDAGGHDANDDRGNDDPRTHDVGDDRGTDDAITHDVGDDHGVDDRATHDVGDDHGIDDPATHDVGDDHGVDDPAIHDIGDDHGVDDPKRHDVGDDHGIDNPATHDIGDDHGGRRVLELVQNARTGQWLFTDDSAEARRWLDDHGRQGARIELPAAASDSGQVPVWRFHDPASDVYFWTADDGLKTELQHTHPELEFQGEAFRAFADDHGGRHQAIGVVWDRDAGPYGSFTYAPVDDAVKLAGQSGDDALVYLGVAFWI